LREEKKEMYSEKMARERYELVEAIQAVIEFHGALDHYQNAAYKGDALKDVEHKRSVWQGKLERVKTYLEGVK
jgi:hypothetical protein